MEENQSQIVKLNVGGKLFLTSSQTLTMYSHTFFSSLLSGRFSSTKDEQGAYFIDRNGEIFGVILDFMRTGEFLVPQNIDIRMVEREARYYGLDDLVSQILILQMPQEPEITNTYIIRYDGYYLLKRKTGSKAAIAFRKLNNSFIYSSGETAAETLEVFLTCKKLSRVWRNCPTITDTYAKMVTKTIRRGRFTTEQDLLPAPLQEGEVSNEVQQTQNQTQTQSQTQSTLQTSIQPEPVSSGEKKGVPKMKPLSIGLLIGTTYSVPGIFIGDSFYLLIQLDQRYPVDGFWDTEVSGWEKFDFVPWYESPDIE